MVQSKNNQNKYFGLQLIEEAQKTAKGGNYFYQFNLGVLQNEKDTLLDTLLKISDKNNDELNSEDYTILGAIAYLFGLDFTSQGYLQEKICNNVQQRFAFLELSDEIIREIHYIFNTKVKELDFSVIKDEMKSLSEELIDTGKQNDPTNVFKTKIRPGLINIINNSILPIQYAIEFQNLKGNTWSYKDLGKINILINQHINLTGKAIKSYTKVYQLPEFNQLLSEAFVREEKGKFALVYLDSILSLSSTLDRLDLDIPDLTNIIRGRFTLDQFSQFRKDWELSQNQIVLEDGSIYIPPTEPEEYKSKYTKQEFDEIFHNQPDVAITEYIKETNKSEIIALRQIEEFIGSLLTPESGDLIQHIYQYLAANIKDPKNRAKPEEFSDLYPHLNIEGIMEHLKYLLNNEQNAYKQLVEFVCQEIPQGQLEHIIKIINNVIETLLLDTQDQKQYLISQYVVNGVKTYNQLQQIVSLIEQTKLFGEDARYYDELYSYLHKDEKIVEIFSKSTEIANFENKISMLIQMKNWFKWFEMPLKEGNKED